MNSNDIVKKVEELDHELAKLRDAAITNIMKSADNALYFSGMAFAASVMQRKVLRLLYDLEGHIKQ